MQPEVIILLAAFASIACGAWAILNVLAGKKTRAAERLEEIRDPMARKTARRQQPGGGQHHI